MTVTSTVVGILISIPIGIGAARNLSPLPVYLVCRAIIAVSRTFQEVIIAILFVAMVGFGPFAGFLTLSFATIGFLAKLLAEDIEDIDPAQAEAIRATGASWLQLVNYAVQPQVMPRLIGLSLYRVDINFRESAVVGIVGAGGIGATLNTALSRYEYDTAAAVLIMIIAIVMFCGIFLERDPQEDPVMPVIRDSDGPADLAPPHHAAGTAALVRLAVSGRAVRVLLAGDDQGHDLGLRPGCADPGRRYRLAHGAAALVLSERIMAAALGYARDRDARHAAGDHHRGADRISCRAQHHAERHGWCGRSRC